MSERLQGEHEARIAALEKLTGQMADDVREVRDFVVGVKARWRMASGLLVGVGAFVGAVFAFVADLAKTAIEKRIAP